MEWVATASVVVLYVATPLDMVPVPRTVAPSLNVIVPVAVAGVTVAVNVTELPNADGLDDDETPVVVVACVTVRLPDFELPTKLPCVGYVTTRL